jgi:hypothetical protein
MPAFDFLKPQRNVDLQDKFVGQLKCTIHLGNSIHIQYVDVVIAHQIDNSL